MSSDFLAESEAIGRRITDEALWHNRRCNWIGAVTNPKDPTRAEYCALEPNLYDGTAGVGLFLARLATVTGDREMRCAAVGALRQALVRARELPMDRRDGFHAGTLGVAWAAARGAALLGVEELHSGAHTLATTDAPLAGADRGCDVILGAAGATLALIALADELEEPAFVDGAVATGEHLLARATVTRHGWSWTSVDGNGRRHLCGLSHGAAGIGWALLELFAATGDDRFRRGAEAAFAYEHSWMDPRSGTWPDLRIGGQRRGAPVSFPSPAVGTWCHGEAGIALTRLRAIGVLGSQDVGPDAERALETTRRHLEHALPYEIDDITLCHGAAGSADVLLTGGDVAPAEGLARTALERYGAAGDWPCGLNGGTSPSLFRGLAGIGWWLLRLNDRAIESPLALPISRLTATSQQA